MSQQTQELVEESGQPEPEAYASLHQTPSRPAPLSGQATPEPSSGRGRADVGSVKTASKGQRSGLVAIFQGKIYSGLRTITVSTGSMGFHGLLGLIKGGTFFCHTHLPRIANMSLIITACLCGLPKLSSGSAH